MSEKKYVVRVESINRRTQCYNGVYEEYEFNDEETARAFYDNLDIAGEYQFLDRGDKREMYLEKNLNEIRDDETIGITYETAGRYREDTYDLYEISEDDGRKFASIEITNGVIKLRTKKPKDNERFADLVGWESDRDWDCRYITDDEYDRLLYSTSGWTILNQA